MSDGSSVCVDDPEMGLEDYVLSGQSFAAYHRWIGQTIAPSLGRKILDVGSGPGNVVEHLLAELPEAEIWATDRDPRAVEILHRRFSKHSRLNVRQLDVTAAEPLGLEATRFDTVTCLNCLEHLEHDVEAMRRMRSFLHPDGRVVILVPAFQALFCSLDEAAGHYRRYSPNELGSRLQEAGFAVESTVFFNFLGLLSWIVNGRLLKHRNYSAAQFKRQNRFVPLLAWMERHWSPPLGLSLIAIGRVPPGR